MTENTKSLIQAVAYDDMAKAKKIATLMLKENKTKKDEYFCRSVLKKIQSEPTFIQLPPDISNFAVMEDVSETFIPERYFCSERERKTLSIITRMDKVGKLFDEKRIKYLNATLLYGESGTGKTTFGKFIAYELNLPFLYLNFSQLISSLLGATAKNLQKVFDFVKKQKCVFMIDEIDAIATQRGQQNDTGELSRIVISLIQALDCLSNGVILVAATNRPDVIDSAVIRRFRYYHDVRKLEQKESIDFCVKYLKSCGYDVSEKEASKIVGNTRKPSEIENVIINFIASEEIKKGNL